MGFVFICLKVSPFPRGGDSGDVGKNGSPEGHRLCEPYQKFDVEGLPSESIKPVPYRGKATGRRARPCRLLLKGRKNAVRELGLVRGGCLFYFFSLRQSKGESTAA